MTQPVTRLEHLARRVHDATVAPRVGAHLEMPAAAYCNAYARGSFTYTPLYLPRGAGLLHKPPRLEERTLGIDTYLPVLRTSMGRSHADHGIPFYYLARGCSDMHIRAGRTLVANNRVHALLRLLHDDAPRAAAALDADCAKNVNSCSSHVLM